MDIIAKLLEILIFSSLTVSVIICEYCEDGTTYSYGYEVPYYKYCSEGCCGTSPNEHCCSSGWSSGLSSGSSSSLSSTSDTADNVVTIIIIVSSVVGGILFLSGLVACICCAVKKKNHTGMMVQPAQPGVAMISATNPGPSYGYPQPEANQQLAGYQQPPGYQLPMPHPNQPSSNTAFPPKGATEQV